MMLYFVMFNFSENYFAGVYKAAQSISYRIVIKIVFHICQ